jgi:hypothetical protein
MNSEELSDKIKGIVQNYWDDKKSPLLLSELPKKLLENDINDYKSIIGKEKSLKQFLLETKNGRYDFAEHSTEKAKIGLTTPGSEYRFEQYENPRKNGNTLISLLNILSGLGDDDLDKINIPTSVIVRMFKK